MSLVMPDSDKITSHLNCYHAQDITSYLNRVLVFVIISQTLILIKYMHCTFKKNKHKVGYFTETQNASQWKFKCMAQTLRDLIPYLYYHFIFLSARI